MPSIRKAQNRDKARERARFAPRGGVSDSRPAVVRENRGLSRKLARKILAS